MSTFVAHEVALVRHHCPLPPLLARLGGPWVVLRTVAAGGVAVASRRLLAREHAPRVGK